MTSAKREMLPGRLFVLTLFSASAVAMGATARLIVWPLYKGHAAARELIEIVCGSAESLRSLAPDRSDPAKFYRPRTDRGLEFLGLVVNSVEDVREARGTDFALPVLTRMLREHDPDLRWRAAFALAQFGEDAKDAVPNLMEILVEAISTEQETLSWVAIYALGKIGPDAAAAIPLLLQAVEQEDVGDAALEAILRINAQETAETNYSHSELKRWYKSWPRRTDGSWSGSPDNFQ